MKKFYFLIIGLLAFSSGSAQSTQLSRFEKVPSYNYYASLNGHLYDGGALYTYVVWDTAVSYNSIISVDTLLNVAWNKSIYTDGSNLANDVSIWGLPVVEQNIYLAMFDHLFIHTIMKADQSGNILWSKKFPAGVDYLTISGLYSHNDYLYVFLTDIGSNANRHVWKIDPAGNIVWQKRFGIPQQFMVVSDVRFDGNDNIYVAGSENGDLFNMKINNNGNLAYAHQYASPDTNDFTVLQGMIPLSDGRLFGCGFSQPASTPFDFKFFYGISDTNGIFTQFQDIDDFTHFNQYKKLEEGVNHTILLSYEDFDSTTSTVGNYLLEFDNNGNLLMGKRTTLDTMHVWDIYELNNGIIQTVMGDMYAGYLFRGPRSLNSCRQYDNFVPLTLVWDISTFPIVNNLTETSPVTSLTNGNDSLMDSHTMDLVNICTSNIGIEENFMKVGMYPNPCTDFLQIETEEEMSGWEIYSMDGKLLVNQKTSGNNIFISTSELNSGVYLLKVYSNEHEAIQKFIKN
jgi:hypothetical protein